MSGMTYTLYVPDVDNAGSGIPRVHEYVRAWLLDRFGGYSATAVDGAYRMADGSTARESVTAYQVIDASGVGANLDYLRDVAQRVKQLAEQETVLLVRQASYPEYVA